jgi:hypothetical protein
MAVILLGTSNNTAKDRAVAGPASRRSPSGAHCGRPLHPFAQLRQKSLKAGVINVLDREIHSYSCRSGLPQNSLAAVSKRGHELDIVLLEERPHMDMERIGRRQLINRCVNKSAKR